MLRKLTKGTKINVTFISLLILSIILMSVDVKKRGKLSMLDELLFDTASIAQRGITNTFRAGRDLWFGYIYLVGLREEGRRLNNEISELRGEINELKETRLENQRLKDLLYYKDSSGYRTATARVIGVSPLSSFKTIIIGKGKLDGIKKGMAVVTNDGIIGRVLSSSENTSKVLLITDRNSDVDAVIQRSRERGLAEGGDTDIVHLKLLDRSADAMIGDVVITSGIGGIFKKGCVIGTISRLEKKPGKIFQYAEIKPAVNFSKLEEVLVITESPEENGG